MTVYSYYEWEFSLINFWDAWHYSHLLFVVVSFLITINAIFLYISYKKKYFWPGFWAAISLCIEIFALTFIGGPIASEFYTTEEYDLWLVCSLVGIGLIGICLSVHLITEEDS